MWSHRQAPEREKDPVELDTEHLCSRDSVPRGRTGQVTGREGGRQEGSPVLGASSLRGPVASVSTVAGLWVEC